MAKLVFESHAIPEYRYFPADCWDWMGPSNWARLRILQACERLDIERRLWPQWNLTLPGNLAEEVLVKPFVAPPFEVLLDNTTSWRRRAEEAFRAHCDVFLKLCKEYVEEKVSSGQLLRVKVARDERAPLELRYEWAARRYFLGQQYKEMASDQHSPAMIRKTVNKILAEAELQNHQVTRAGHFRRVK